MLEQVLIGKRRVLLYNKTFRYSRLLFVHDIRIAEDVEQVDTTLDTKKDTEKALLPISGRPR